MNNNLRINSLRPNNIWVNKLGHHVFRKWLVAWSATSHYLNQEYYWLDLRSSFQWHVHHKSNILIHENAFYNVICEMVAILSRWGWGNLSPFTIKIQYRITSNISRTLADNKIVDNSDVVGASPVGAAPTTSSFSTSHLASMDWAKTTARGYKKNLSLGIWCDLY